MITKLAILAALVIVSAAPALAQDTEVYAGAAFTRANPQFNRASLRFERDTDQLGAEVTLTRYFSDSPVGISGDFAGTWNSGSDSRLLTAMGGVSLKARDSRFQPFGRALVGGARFDAAVGHETGWAFAFGGGLDIKANDRVAIRAIQADWLTTRMHDKNVRHARLGVGLVFNF